MAAEYKPQDYNSVSPYLTVKDANRTIAFLVRVFDAVELRRYPTPEGRIMHAEVRIDDTVVMIADNPAGQPDKEAHVHVYVPDVDAVYRRALQAGGESVQEPIKKADEDKRGGVKDAGGTTWWMATKVE